MASSQFRSKNNKLLNEAEKVRKILSKDTFYSELPEPELTEVTHFLERRVLLTCVRNDPLTESHVWQTVLSQVRRSLNKLAELKENQANGIPTHAKQSWSIRAGYNVIASSIKDQFQDIFERNIFPAMLDTANFTEQYHSFMHNSSYATAHLDNLVEPYQIIFTTIFAKYPEAVTWPKWTRREMPKLNLSDDEFIFQVTLISFQGFAKRAKAEKILSKLTAIPEYKECVSIIQKGKHYFLEISAPLELVKKLKKTSSLVNSEDKFILEPPVPNKKLTVSQKMERVKIILSNNDFYLKFPAQEFTEVNDFIEYARKKLKASDEASRSQKWTIPITMVDGIKLELDEMKANFSKGKLTDPNAVYIIANPDVKLKKMPGYIDYTVSIKNYILSIFVEYIFPAVLNLHQFKNSNQLLKKNNGWKHIQELFIPPLIIAAIEEKYAKFNAHIGSWISVQQALSAENIDSGNIVEINHYLITMRGMEKKLDAEKWARKLNAIPGFDGHMGVKQKADGYFIIIHSYTLLNSKLEKLREEKNNEKSSLQPAQVTETHEAIEPPASRMGSPDSTAGKNNNKAEFSGLRAGFLNR